MRVFYDNLSSCCPSHMRDWVKIQNTLPDFRLVKSLYSADIVIIYLCAMSKMFIDAIDGILAPLQTLKTQRPNVKVFVGGCAMGVEDIDITLEDYEPYIDGFFDKSNMAEVVLGALHLVESKTPAPYIEDNIASISISTGCLRKCSFCKTNYLNYPFKSTPRQQIFDEIGEAVFEKHILHICLTGENTTEYGIEEDGKMHLEELIREIFKRFPMIKVMDIMGVTLDEISDTLFKYFIRESRIQRIQIEVQSFTYDVRQAMNLSTDMYRTKMIYEKLRETKDILGGIIVGHPGETDENFEATCEYIKRINAWSLTVVALDDTPNTKSYYLSKPPVNVALEREKEILKITYSLRKKWACELIMARKPVEAYVLSYDEKRQVSTCRMLGQPVNIEVPGQFNLCDTVSINLDNHYSISKESVLIGLKGSVISD